jgi:hypothetical protein
METPGTHCSESDLARYAQRALPWRELLQVDRHLKGCTDCAARLSEHANPRRAGALLRAVTRDEAHLTYEQIEAVAEGKLELHGPLKMHTNECPVCRNELRDLKAFVLAFRTAKPRPTSAAAAAASGSWLDALRNWFEGPRQISAAAAVIATVAVGGLLASRAGLVGSNAASGGNSPTASHAVVTDSPRHVSRAFEDCVAKELAASSPEWAAMYRSGDYPKLVGVLSEAATNGSALAQTTLGLLTAKGVGTDPDAAAARAWLQRGASQGDVCARRGLAGLATVK